MNKSIKNAAQAGFTLIELIVVIVILGILAATALPKFANMSNEARYSALQGMRGGITSAVALAHAQALAQNQTGATGSVTMDGTPIALAYGYPTAAVIETLAGLSGVTKLTSANAGDTGYNGPTIADATSVAFMPSGIATKDAAAAKCYVLYKEAKLDADGKTVLAQSITMPATAVADCQ